MTFNVSLETPYIPYIIVTFVPICNDKLLTKLRLMAVAPSSEASQLS